MTAAFQNNAFQPNAFQMGSDGVPLDETQHSIISDGSETVHILHEQNLNVDCLGFFNPPGFENEHILGDGQGLDTQDFTDFIDYTNYRSFTPIDDYGDCQYPAVKSITTGADDTVATNHSVTLPSFAAGDRIIIFYSCSVAANVSTTGWGELISTIRCGASYRDMDGTEGSTININTPGSDRTAWVIYVINAGTFNSGTPPEAATTSSASGEPDPPNLSPTWAADKTMWFAAFGSANDAVTVDTYPYVDGRAVSTASNTSVSACYTLSDSASVNPPAFAVSPNTSWTAATIAVLGFCDHRIEVSNLASYEYEADYSDYSFTQDSIQEDAAPVEDPIFWDGQGLDYQDFTDLADYSDAQSPLSDDNNPDICVAAIALDDQDFTDLSDYGAVEPQAIPDNNPELAPSSLDDQDFTDQSEYGFIQQSGDEQDHHLGTGDGLDQQDFTDLSDYGYSVDPLTDDFVLREDALLSADGLDSQDFTDLTDYGSVVDQPIDDNNPDLAPSSLDDQDFTDFTDYGSSVDQLSTDHVDFILGIALDDQDRTDLADYGSITEQAIPDNDQNFRPDMVALDTQDFTDLTDYGSVVEQLSDNLREDFVLGDGQGLDDQDFTDLADYGSSLDPLSEDTIAPQDFVLGDGQGLDAQDFTDLADYGYQYSPIPDNVTNVDVTGVEITVQVGCFHAFGFGAIADGSTAWATAPTNSTAWSQLANAGDPGWAVTSNGSTVWTGSSSAPDTDWEEDC